MRASPQPRGRLLRHLTSGVLLLLLGLAAVLAPFLFRIWKANAARGGQQPAEPFRIAGNYRAYLDTAEAEFRQGVVH
jgi:hypothetical protein